MLSNLDETFLFNFKSDFPASSNSSSSSELLSNYSSIETALSPSLDGLSNFSSERTTFQSDISVQRSTTSFRTHFDLTNPDDWLVAFSLLKESVVQIERSTPDQLQRLSQTNSISTNGDLPRVRGPKSTRFTCPICGLITVSIERLQRHVNQHGQKLRLETSKPERKLSTLICEKCKATFSSAYALRKHQRVHTRDKPFSCDFCGSRFSQWGNLRHHIQRHLGISPYACPYCKKTFIAPCKLEVHIRGHLDERPYVCDRCQATFRCNDDLRKHLIIHADYKPFVCWLCAKPFFHASKLRMHLKEKHNTDVIIRKKDVLESGTEYEITFVNDDQQTTLNTPNDDPYETILRTDDEQTEGKLILGDQTCDEPVNNYQLLNEFTVNDIETLVKNNPFVLAEQDLRSCSSGTHHHHQHFDELKFIDFPVM